MEERVILWVFYIFIVGAIFLFLANYVIKNINDDNAYEEKVLAADLAMIHDSIISISGNVNGNLNYKEQKDVSLLRGNDCLISVGTGLFYEHKGRFYCNLAGYEKKINIVGSKTNNMTIYDKEGDEIYIGQDGK